MFLTLKSFAMPQRGGALALAAAAFAAGLAAATLGGHGNVAVTEPAPAPRTIPAISQAGHPTEVLRVVDGDTFEARVHVWPGMEITTKVRLRGIDTPELHARCADERAKAVAARQALAQILNEGAVGITRVGRDKYGGRVDADVSTARTADVSAALIDGGYARRYSGGRRASWCG